MNASKIIDAVISENLLDAKNYLNSLLYSRTEQALEEKTEKIVDETFNNKDYVDCNEAGEGDKEAYQKFFKSALKKFGVTEPGQLEGDKKKEFYNYIDKNWKSDAEKETGKEDPKESVEVDKDGVEEASDVDIAKEKEKIAVSQERIKSLSDRQKREKQTERN
jgi:hypothetical protein